MIASSACPENISIVVISKSATGLLPLPAGRAANGGGGAAQPSDRYCRSAQRLPVPQLQEAAFDIRFHLQEQRPGHGVREDVARHPAPLGDVEEAHHAPRYLTPGLRIADEDRLAGAAEGGDRRFAAAPREVGHDDEGGQLIGVHEEDDELGRVGSGDALQGLHDHVFGGNLGDRQAAQPLLDELGRLEEALALGHVAAGTVAALAASGSPLDSSLSIAKHRCS